MYDEVSEDHSEPNEQPVNTNQGIELVHSLFLSTRPRSSFFQDVELSNTASPTIEPLPSKWVCWPTWKVLETGSIDSSSSSSNSDDELTPPVEGNDNCAPSIEGDSNFLSPPPINLVSFKNTCGVMILHVAMIRMLISFSFIPTYLPPFSFSYCSHYVY